jgi:hypothetical protein
MLGLKNSLAKTELIDSLDTDTTIHIKVDSDHLQKDKHLSLFLLEQMVSSTYQDAIVQKFVNEYGLLTDVYIKFTSVNDAIHFRLMHYN